MALELAFATKALRDICESEATAKEKLGAKVADALKRRLSDFRSIDSSHTHPEDNVAACLKYFGVGNVKEWRSKYSQVLSLVSFRTSPTHKSEPGSVIAWLRYGELKSEEIPCRTWNPDNFARSLIGMRRLTRKKSPSAFIPELRRLCAENGVACLNMLTMSDDSWEHFAEQIVQSVCDQMLHLFALKPWRDKEVKKEAPNKWGLS
jgi:hypothetical protein